MKKIKIHCIVINFIKKKEKIRNCKNKIKLHCIAKKNRLKKVKWQTNRYTINLLLRLMTLLLHIKFLIARSYFLKHTSCSFKLLKRIIIYSGYTHAFNYNKTFCSNIRSQCNNYLLQANNKCFTGQFYGSSNVKVHYGLFFISYGIYASDLS